MPMYEFYCPTCNVMRTFFSRRPSLRIPECPSCGTKLVREVSTFRTGTSDGTDELGDAAMDEAAITRALELFGPKLDKLVSNGDPKASAKRIREFAETSGLSFRREVRGLLARFEDGGDPQKLAEEFDSMVDAGEIAFTTEDRHDHGKDEAGRLGDKPPVDPTIYELPSEPLPPLKPNAFSH